MRSIRKFAYAAVLGLSIFAIQPTLAAAEEARGVFTLSQEVHWQNAVLGPGDYAFSLKGAGRPTFLMIRGINGTDTDAMLLISEVRPGTSTGTGKLISVPRGGQRFVSSMELPECDIALYFTVPREKAPPEVPRETASK
jgi:hypothetical protein